MSARTMTGFGRFLSHETRQAVNAVCAVDYDDYAANAETKLRARGQHALAVRMLEEIEEACRDKRNLKARRRAAEALGYSSPDDVPDEIAANYK